MKRLLFLLTLLLALVPASSFSSTQTPTEIPLLEENPPGDRPRSSSPIPISAYVISNTIYITFSNDLGEVDVTVEEASQGIILQTSVDSSELSAILPFGGAAGEYMISFTLQTGVSYCGLFEL